MQNNNKKKICIVASSLGKGGAEKSAATLTTMLYGLGHEIHVVTIQDFIHYDYSGKLFNLGKLKKKKDSLLGRIYRLFVFKRYLKKHDFDFIIDHRSKSDFLKEFIYNKIIYSNTSKIYVVHSYSIENIFKNKSFAALFKNNFATVVVSNHIEEILNRNDIKNTYTIQNAFKPNIQMENNVEFNELQTKRYLLSYGRIVDEVKDYKFLIRSFSISKVWNRDVFLVILGDGKDKETLKDYAKQFEGFSHILFYPFVKNPFTYVKNSLCVCLTSYYEGFPMVLLESLSLETPVISLNIKSGPSEIIKNGFNGLLVEERDEKQFAEAICKIIDDEKLYEYLKQNTQDSVNQFSMEEIAKKWNKLLCS